MTIFNNQMPKASKVYRNNTIGMMYDPDGVGESLGDCFSINLLSRWDKCDTISLFSTNLLSSWDKNNDMFLNNLMPKASKVYRKHVIDMMYDPDGVGESLGDCFSINLLSRWDKCDTISLFSTNLLSPWDINNFEA